MSDSETSSTSKTWIISDYYHDGHHIDYPGTYLAPLTSGYPEGYEPLEKSNNEVSASFTNLKRTFIQFLLSRIELFLQRYELDQDVPEDEDSIYKAFKDLYAESELTCIEEIQVFLKEELKNIMVE